ncbi:hypothetical protein EV182_000885 [Spiromyces aspiralis]|uniref:Uncharacterized protein n=1 Tax=Spiromyces aspiralis TaxID=68401 RepID=A0ACC1HHG5_9FUNG|nr:hypothetical protein EV182_000885 [Spiromyces aspiralis]
MLSAGDLDQLVPPSAALGVDAVDRGEGHRNGHGYSSDEAPGQMRSPKRHRREPARTRTTRPSKPQVSAKAQGTRNDAASNGSMQQQQQQGQKGRGVPAMRDAPPELVGRCEAESKKYNKLGRDHKHRGDKAREAHNELRAIAHYLEAVGCFVQSLWYSDVYLAPQVLLDRWRTVVDFVDFVYNECDKLRESAMAGIAAMIRATANYVIGRVYLEQARRISSGIAGKNENGGDENEEEEAVVEEGRKANNSASSKLARRSRAAAECSQKSAENADQAERWFIVSEARLSVAHLMQQFENTLQDHVLATRGEGESDVQRRYEARNAPEDYPNHPHSAASMHSTLSTRPLAYPLSPMSNMLDVVAFCQSILYEWMSHKGIRDLI